MARTFMTRDPKKLIARWRKRAALVTPEMMEAERENLQTMKKEAIRLSSATAFRLPNSDHPYSTRDPHPPIPPYWINIQSAGGFVTKWRVRLIKTPSGATGSLWNTAPYAKYMLGTSRMIQRPILQRMAKRVRDRRSKRNRQAVHNFLEPD